jgi:leucyl/phenylalanyl-tRNA--protein transferase
MENKIHWLLPDDPPDSFPDVAKALRDPDGLLAIGGNLTPERIILAYRRGIFPWYDDEIGRASCRSGGSRNARQPI